MDDLLEKYNYDSFVPEKFMPWMRFNQSPPLGTGAQDFPLWTIDENETSLAETWRSNLFTVVEFGSFT